MTTKSGASWSARAGRRPGHFVVLVGPDGVGKTTVAAALLNGYQGPSLYFHFRPPLRGGIRPEPGIANPSPVSLDLGLRPVGWLRLATNVLRFWLGYLVTVRPALRRGALVVGDRWAYGYLARPASLRFYGPPRLAQLAINILPRPDLVALLAAPPKVVSLRKGEVTEKEAQQESEAWSLLPIANLERFDTVRPASEVAAAILARLRVHHGPDAASS